MRGRAATAYSLQPGLDAALALPAGLSGNQFCGALADAQHGQHGVDGGHGGEDTSIGNAQALDAADLELLVDDGELVGPDVAHLGRAGRVVHGVRDAAGILGQLLVRLQFVARRDLALDPVLERRFVGDLARRPQPEHERRRVVALGVCEVPEVERRLDAWVCGREVQASAGARARDVGCHAERIDWCVVSQACGVQAERDLVAVHHHVGDVAVGEALGVEDRGWVRCRSVGSLAPQENACIRVHGGLVRRDGLVEFPDDDGFGVVQEVLTHAGNVLHHGDGEGAQLLLGAQAGEKHQARRVDGARAEDGFGLGGQCEFLARLEGHIDAADGVALVKVDLGHPGVGQDLQVVALLFLAEDGVDVCD